MNLKFKNMSETKRLEQENQELRNSVDQVERTSLIIGGLLENLDSLREGIQQSIDQLIDGGHYKEDSVIIVSMKNLLKTK